MKLSDLLENIVGMEPLKFSWLDSERCWFQTDAGKLFGIYVEYRDLKLETNLYTLANISFGIISGKNKYFTAEDLNTELTKDGTPRLIFSTVAKACITNEEVKNSDLILLAGSDQKRKQRSALYSLAFAQIQTLEPAFSKFSSFQVKTTNDTHITVLSKVKFTEQEKEFIADKLGIIK